MPKLILCIHEITCSKLVCYHKIATRHLVFQMILLYHAVAYSLCTGLYPNVPLQNPTETPEFTQPGILFVYNWPVDDQALCPGTVTALDYCYQTSIRSSGQDNRTIFTLLLLNSSYRIIQTINVSNLTSPDNCGNRGGITTCCNRQQLRPEQLFQVPDSPVAGFGIFSRTGVDTILAFRGSSSIVGTVTGFQLTASAVIVNNRISVRQNGISIQYRMLNFVIGKQSQCIYNLA